MFLQSYFKDQWNTFDFVTVVGSIVDALMVEFAVSCEKKSENGIKVTNQDPVFATFSPVEKLHQRRFPTSFPSRSLGQALEAGLHHPNPALDFRPVLQGPALRHPAHRHAVLHLRHHRHAGLWQHRLPSRLAVQQARQLPHLWSWHPRLIQVSEDQFYNRSLNE